MRIPVGWLREYVTFDVPLPDLGDRLAVSTCEVERITRTGVADEDGNLGLYRVGRVLEAGKHPNADRLQLCQVDVGEGEPRQIVCGAWNFGAGATVAVALPGAVLPNGNRLERTKLRGAVSDGMILSERELELGADHTGILVLPEGPEPGTPLADVIPLGEEVLEVEVTGNRPDLLSVYGIAREVAALFDGVELAPWPGRELERDEDEQVDVAIEDLEAAPRYIGRLFRDVEIAPSPPWLKARLIAAGLRPISNVVDVTNYVMHALGNPLHAFDADMLVGGKVLVRPAGHGEHLRTLDGTDRRLDSSMLVIADAQRAVALAGIMGGEETEVRPETRNVMLEAANFEPAGILQTSERLALRTDGSNRWEKGVDPYLAEPAAVYATELLVELSGARWTGSIDVKGVLPERPVVRFRPDRANRLIGIDVLAGEQRRLLERLQFDVEDDWSVTVPTWRAHDVTREADVVEEVARVHLAEVPFTLPRRSAMFGTLTKEQRLRRVVEDGLTAAGFSEAYTWSITDADDDPRALRLPDAISGVNALRTSLFRGLLGSAHRNLDAGNDGIALFEIARVYLPRDGDLPAERRHAGGIAEGGFFRAKGAVERIFEALKLEPRFERAEHDWLHPGKAATVQHGWLGELHPSLLEGAWGAFELDLDDLFADAPAAVEYEDVITYPAVRQDLAFVVDEDMPAGELIAAVREAAGPELREARVFDVYHGGQIPAGRKSVAVHVAFQSSERTLSDEDAAAIRTRIVSALAERFSAELRT
jgi:phenylalanyl-tRNA synthetase beta chain